MKYIFKKLKARIEQQNPKLRPDLFDMDKVKGPYPIMKGINITISLH